MLASVVDLVGIEGNLKSYFTSNNTTAGAPIRNLSTSMTNKVSNIVEFNPNFIRVQASFYPAVAIFVENKTINLSKGTIAVDQLTSIRNAELTIKVLGLVWNSNLTDDTQDPAARDCRYLMENIEYVLRGYPTFGGKVSWQNATDCTYHDVNLGEDVHLRVGVLNVSAKVNY